MKIRTKAKIKKINIIGGPARFYTGSTAAEDINIGDTFTYDGIHSKVARIRQTNKCVFILTSGGYERKFLKDTYVDIEI
jgi:hypothetical protein